MPPAELGLATLALKQYSGPSLDCTLTGIIYAGLFGPLEGTLLENGDGL